MSFISSQGGLLASVAASGGGTDPLVNFTELKVNFNGSVVDESPNSRSLSRSGSFSYTFNTPFGNNGVDRVANVRGDDVVWSMTTFNNPHPLGSGDFCIEAWVKLQEISSTIGSHGIIGDYDNNFFNDGSFRTYINTSGHPVFSTNSEGSRTFSNHTLTIETWHHVAFSRESGVIRCYLDGANDATNAWTKGGGIGGDSGESIVMARVRNGVDLVGDLGPLRVVVGDSVYKVADAPFSTPSDYF